MISAIANWIVDRGQSKPQVHYVPIIKDYVPILGWPTVIRPFNHPDHKLVSNTQAVLTSPVVAIGPYGVFETKNTTYVPFNEQDGM